MENLYLAFSVIFPLLVYMAIGFIAARTGLWDEKSAMAMNRMAFSVLMPAHLFENIRVINLEQGVNYPLILYAGTSILITCALLYFAVPRLEKEDKRRSVMIQGIFRSNFILFGLAISRSLWGDGDLSETTTLMAAMIPMFNILAVLVLELFRGGKVNWIRLGRNLVTNPLIVATVAGLAALFFSVPIPSFVAAAAGNLGRAATPMALAALGGCFRFGGIKNCFRPLVITVSARLVLMPAVWLTLAALLGFRGLAIITLLPFYGAPTAVASYTMALQMGGDGELASQVLVYTSVLSIFTIFVLILITKSLGLF